MVTLSQKPDGLTGWARAQTALRRRATRKGETGRRAVNEAARPVGEETGARVLTVAPCLNEEKHLPHVLAGLLADPGAGLIVVADGGSTDASRQIVTDLAAQYPDRLVLMHNPARRQSAGVNLAVRTYGEGRDWLVRVDAHARYPENYASRLIEAAGAKGADSVVVPMYSVGRTCFQTAAALAQNSYLGTGGSAHRMAGPGKWVDHGHHALMRLSLYQAVGGYDERFSHNEDAELDVRLARAGGRIWLDGDLGIEYLPRASVTKLFWQYYSYGKGRVRTIRLHRIKVKARQALPAAIAPILLLALAAPVTGGLAALPAALWALGSIGAGALLALRVRSLCGLMSGPAAMAMHLGWSLGFWRELYQPRGVD